MMFREIRAANVLGTVPRREHWALKILTPIHPTVHQPVAAAVVSLAPARMNLRAWLKLFTVWMSVGPSADEPASLVVRQRVPGLRLCGGPGEDCAGDLAVRRQ